MNNRNKKLRKIIVDDQQYMWLVGDFNCDGDYSSRVKIFKNKKCIYDKLNIENDITKVDAITPKIIETIIRENLLEREVPVQ